jgi:hypothetical protein
VPAGPRLEEEIKLELSQTVHELPERDLSGDRRPPKAMSRQSRMPWRTAHCCKRCSAGGMPACLGKADGQAIDASIDQLN